MEQLPWQLIEEMAPYIDFKAMSKDPTTSEHLLHNHSRHFDFRKLLQNNKQLSMDFIRNHAHSLSNCWDLISVKIPLSEAHMEEFEPLLDWKLLSRYQDMSEEFIKKHKHRVDWDAIATHQAVFRDFIIENRPVELDS